MPPPETRGYTFEVSWVFALFLAIYAAIWSTMWMQGQLRWARSEARRAQPPKAAPTPKHLPDWSKSLYSRAAQLRVELWPWAQMCRRVRITDPDVRFGSVRSSDFRRAVHEGARLMHGFVRTLERIELESPERLTTAEDLVLALRAVDQRLAATAKLVAQSRALEAFAVSHCDACIECFDRAERLLGELGDLLASRRGAHPYRPGREFGGDGAAASSAA